MSKNHINSWHPKYCKWHPGSEPLVHGILNGLSTKVSASGWHYHPSRSGTCYICLYDLAPCLL